MDITENEFLWVERYRPKTIDDCVLPPRLKEYFKEQLRSGVLQNMLLCGSAGTGKTTVAKALCNELGIDVLLVNASESGNIDNLRTTIRSFASTVSFLGGVKCVILDEADYLTTATQPALRGFIEEFSNNCRFILTCNFKHKIIDPIHSRMAVVEFVYTKEEKRGLIVEFDKRVREILDHEKIEYDKKMMQQIVMKYFPDFRRVLGELQRHSKSGALSSTSIAALADDSVKTLVGYLKNREFASMRKWVVDNIDQDMNHVSKVLYERMNEYVEPESVGPLILFLAEYDYKQAFVVNREINFVAMLVQLMVECKFK